MHSKDVYWIARQALGAKDGFQVLLASENNLPAGYLDITCFLDINEPFHIFVDERYLGPRYGMALVAKAIELNGKTEMDGFIAANDTF